MKTDRFPRGSEGFTLVEVMIAMFFLLFIIQGVAMVNLHAQRSSIYSRRLTSANMLAEKAMERFRNTDYDNLILSNGAVECFDIHMAGTACGGSDAAFSQTTTVASDTPIVGISQIDVTVVWEQKWTWNTTQDTDPYEAKIVSYISKF